MGEKCRICDHRSHESQCRELVMPGPPGDVDECGCTGDEQTFDAKGECDHQWHPLHVKGWGLRSERWGCWFCPAWYDEVFARRSDTHNTHDPFS